MPVVRPSIKKLNTGPALSESTHRKGVAMTAKKALRDAIDVKLKVPAALIREFDEVARKRGSMTRSEAIRDAMQRYVDTLRESQTTHTERIDG